MMQCQFYWTLLNGPRSPNEAPAYWDLGWVHKLDYHTSRHLYIFWDWATSRWANILRNKIENHPNVYIYWEIELKIFLMAIFSETRNWKSCRWIYFLWGPKWSELLLWEGGEPWWRDPVSSARQLPTQPTFVLGAEYFLPGLYTRLSTNYEQNKSSFWTKSSLD